jgi:SagB-type dehydrogenase family enzyme
MKEIMISSGLITSGSLCLLLLLPILMAHASEERTATAKVTKLPQPKLDGKLSLEKAISQRRSEREYKDEALLLSDISQILWAAQGITHPSGYRAAPSAGALYPIEICVAAGQVQGLPAGVYRYRPQGHDLLHTAEGDKRAALAAAALGQSWVKNAPAVVIISAVYERTTRKYRDRGIKYVHYEAGHVAQNISLQAVSLDLGTVDIGAFYDSEVKKVLNLANEEEPLIIMPLGKRSY